VAGVAIHLKRLGLPSTAIQREHQLHRQPLAGRMLGPQPLQLAHQCTVRAAREVGLHARLQRHQALLLQARDLRRRERLELQVRQRRPMPQIERFTQHDPGALGIARVKRPPTLRDATREALGVKLARSHPQPVTGRRRANRPGVPERLAQPRDVHLHRLDRPRRRVLAPQPNRQALRTHRLVGMQQQHRQDRARLETFQPHRTALTVYFKRPEYLKVHQS
jgi:hypothetical protein